MLSLLAIMASFAIAPEASAQTTTPNINAPRTNNRARILQDKKADRADGVVTHDEHQDSRKDKRQANRVIYGQKHDKQTQPCALH